MDCSDVRKILPEYIEGNNPPGQQALIDEHLRSCEQCMLYAAELKKTIETLQGLDEIEPPAWLTTKIMKRIRTEALPKKGLIEKLFLPLRIKVTIEAFAAILIVVTVIYIFRDIQHGPVMMEVKQEASPESFSPPPPKADGLTKPQAEQKVKAEAGQDHAPVPLETTMEKDSSNLPVRRAEQPAEEEKRSSKTEPVLNIAPAGKLSESPAAPSPVMKQAGPSGSAIGRQKAGVGAPSTSMDAMEKKEVQDTGELILSVSDIDSALKHVEAITREYRGHMDKGEFSENSVALTITISPEAMPKLLQRLQRLGTIGGRKPLPSGTNDLTITLILKKKV